MRNKEQTIVRPPASASVASLSLRVLVPYRARRRNDRVLGGHLFLSKNVRKSDSIQFSQTAVFAQFMNSVRRDQG